MSLDVIYSKDQSRIEAYAESRIGGRPENQDSYGWKNTHFGFLVTVCDGMGGGPGGKTASSIAVKSIVAGIEEGSENERLTDIIKKALYRANTAIIEAGNCQPSLKGMGSTAALLLVTEKAAYIAHVGDSRVYHLRGRKIVYRTFDHSMVFEMVAKGVITEEQARLSANSNVITRALGISPDIMVDVIEVAYKKGDRFMLCSDGIHGVMPEKELIKMATCRKKSIASITTDIATFVDDLGNENGKEHDNLTLAMIETKEGSKSKPISVGRKDMFILVLLLSLVVSLIFNFVQCGNAHNDNGKTDDKESVESESDTTKNENGFKINKKMSQE